MLTTVVKLHKHWFSQVLLCTSMLLNAVLGGWHDESLSARAWRLEFHRRRWHFMRVLIDRLFWWEPAHCQAAYFADQKRRSLSPGERELRYRFTVNASQ